VDAETFLTCEGVTSDTARWVDEFY